ncbi:NmrA family NAD(P)-binding protein [Flammeovirga pacifica]|uniref:NmrA family NAD(P)-binding protein n=1 Tax=Flammeovirga pacifica TaxID=915059 RepID=UPI000694F9F0|nr:NmrA family NAD(P)-binding protein [Flammeovirga pacifica]
MKILITGATGNIGKPLIQFLERSSNEHQIYATVRNINNPKNDFLKHSSIELLEFDFENIDHYPRL